MKKYTLINNTTHRIVYTTNENTKNQLLKEGFHIDSKDGEPAVKTEKKARTKKQSCKSSKGDKVNETEN